MSVTAVLLMGWLMVDVECWCCAVRRMVVIRGEVVGRRAAELLEVVDCLEVGCPRRGAVGCLVGMVREGRWR